MTPTAATTLHEQQGLRITKNAKNGFVVARLHYTADPRKRSPEWKAAARQGMSQAKFEQEFEINYDALLGERVFPEITDRRHEIVHRTGPYLDGVWPDHLPMWGGFDYGQKNPSSFHIYTIVDGVVWAIWEMYKPCRNITEFAEEMKQCPYWARVRYIAHDPDMDNLKIMTRGEGTTSVRRMFETLGVTRWLRGNNDEQAWLARMQKHWCGVDVTFKILDTCPMLIDEFAHATYVSMTERQLETQNYRETLVDKHNHAMDDCKYFMNSDAAPVVRNVKLPNLLSAYSWGSAPSSNRRVY
jgi:hypothetical protein